MAETATLARPYAGAAFDIAREADRLDQWSRQLASLAAAAAVEEVKDFIASPSLPGPAKAHRIIELLGDELGTDARRFVHVLADNKRLDITSEIAEQFEALKAAAERTLDVEIISAVQLTENQLKGFVSGLTERFGQEIEVETRVDENVVGGAVIRAGDTVIDGSVRGRIAKLTEALLRT